MDYQKLSEESLDKIMCDIRKMINQNEPNIIRKDNSSAEESHLKDIEMDIITEHLNSATIGKEIGLNKAPMHAKHGIVKQIARIVEAIYLRISELITRDIRTFNSEILIILHSIKRKLFTYEDQIAHLNEYIEQLQEQINTQTNTNNVYENRLLIQEENLKKIAKQYEQIKKEQENWQSLESLRLTEKVEAISKEFYKKILEEENRTSNLVEQVQNELKSCIEHAVEEFQNDTDLCNKKEYEQLRRDLTDYVESERETITDQLNVFKSHIDDMQNNCQENSAYLIERNNKNELLLHQANENIIQLKSILKWENSTEFTANLIKKRKAIAGTNSLFYHDFEEKFRGSRNDIKERLRIYLPILERKNISWETDTFVDLGCGRGEWLDLLVEKGAKNYTGIDINDIQLNICHEYGHTSVLNCDCVEYVQQLESESINVITGFQIIEHLGIECLLLLLSECYRVLKKGGVMLFETPNAKNLITGSTYFYADPTHERPLLKEVMQFFAEHSGFSITEIIDANPARYSQKLLTPICTDGNQSLWEQNITILNDLLYGAQDYAILGVKNE